jgi:hypothetical protein
MYQQEIEFFWPLTEQIPLELDYNGCHLPKYVLSNAAITNFGFGATVPYSLQPTWTTSINVDTNNITVTSKNKPPLYRRILFKLLGITWKQI